MDSARRGDRQALERLLTSHYDRVHALCRRMLSSDADALDATQDALLAAVRALDRFDGRSSFGTWLYRIATNTCIDELRRRRRRPSVGLPFDDGRDGPGTLSRPSRRRDLWVEGDHPSLASGPAARAGPGAVVSDALGVPASDPADTAAARIDVDAALGRLATEFRAAVVLRDVCDLSYEEIACVLGVPVGTVRSRIARGRTALAETLSAHRSAVTRRGTPAEGVPRNRTDPRDVEHHDISARPGDDGPAGDPHRSPVVPDTRPASSQETRKPRR